MANEKNSGNQDDIIMKRDQEGILFCFSLSFLEEMNISSKND